jgi:hypothetical protein
MFHSWLERDGIPISEASLPVRLAWGVRPISALPTVLAPGQLYSASFKWEELPSYENYPFPLIARRLGVRCLRVPTL